MALPCVAQSQASGSGASSLSSLSFFISSSGACVQMHSTEDFSDSEVSAEELEQLSRSGA